MMIQTYSFGEVVIDGRKYHSDVMIFPDGRIEDSWWRTSGHVLSLADLTALIAAQPEVIVAGTGAAGMMRVDPDVAPALAKRNIAFYALPTGEAVERINELLRHNLKVGAGLHLTC